MQHACSLSILDLLHKRAQLIKVLCAMTRPWVLYGTHMGLVPWIAGNLGHQSTGNTGHTLFLDTSKCTMKAWRKTWVSCYALSHIFLFLVLRRTLLLFSHMLAQKRTRRNLSCFSLHFLELPWSDSPLACSISNFLKSRYLIQGKNYTYSSYCFGQFPYMIYSWQ